jgi:predicted PurR-regulated permease PerM
MNDKKTTRIRNNNLGGAGLSLLSVCFVLIVVVVTLGAYYLYQVNDLATKGYEMKDMEIRIQQLQKENKKMQIKEIELRSMYNLEKATENLDLVNAQNVTYVEMKSPVAMK